MSVNARIVCAGTDETALVRDGRLVVGPRDYSQAYNGTLGTDDAVVNIIPAKAECQFVITGIILRGNKNISTTVDAVVDVYEATSATSSTAAKTILSVPVARSGELILTNIFINTDTGAWVNAKTSDDDVYVVILGYYLEQEFEG